MNKYTEIMDRVRLTPEQETRIRKNIQNERRSGRRSRRQNRGVWAASFFVAVLAVSLLAYFVGGPSVEPDRGVGTQPARVTVASTAVQGNLPRRTPAVSAPDSPPTVRNPVRRQPAIGGGQPQAQRAAEPAVQSQEPVQGNAVEPQNESIGPLLGSYFSENEEETTTTEPETEEEETAPPSEVSIE